MKHTDDELGLIVKLLHAHGTELREFINHPPVDTSPELLQEKRAELVICSNAYRTTIVSNAGWAGKVIERPTVAKLWDRVFAPPVKKS